MQVCFPVRRRVTSVLRAWDGLAAPSGEIMKTCSVCRRSWADDFRVCPIDGLPLQDAGGGPTGSADPQIGRMLGNSRVVEKIADGDLGPVYKAEDPVRGAVALQMIAKDRVASPILLEAFVEAVKLSAQINHPHVVRVFGAETGPDGTPSVTMEFVPGVTLQKYCQGRPGMSPAEVCGLVRQTAEGLVAAHRVSVLHGALHPARILVTPDGTVKVGGFHRSGLREGVDAFTATAATLPYLAPEQLGVVRDVVGPDYRTDVYSLGVILYELLAGRLPYEARNPQEMATIMEGAPPLPPNFANPHVSPLLSRVVLRAMAKHPTERHASMEEFMRELDAAGQPAREPERPAPPRYEPQYPPPRSQDTGLFAHSAPAADSGLFAPAPAGPRRESPESLWPEAAPEKAGSGEGSVFNWFKTRIGPKSGARPVPSRQAPDDSLFSNRAPVRHADDDLEERTVVVTGAGHRRKSMRDTFFGGGRRGRDMDLSGTGTLPRRRFSSKVYVILGIAAVLLIGVVSVLLYLSTASSTGKLRVDSTPPGAQVFVNDEPRGSTPLPFTELAAGSYRLRIQLDGYETKIDTVEIAGHADVQRAYILAPQAALPAAAIAPPEPPPGLPLPQAPPARVPPYASMINAALRARNFFPPAADNAFDLLQRWQQTPGEENSQALDQARQSFCRELESLGREKLDQKDFSGARALLDQGRSHSVTPNCATGLQAAYQKAVGSSLSDLRISARAAMDRQNYITPESDNALRYVRVMLAIDPQDNEARALDAEIVNRAWDQARTRGNARQHQDALDAYMQIKEHYPNPPFGAAALDQAIEHEKARLSLFKAMNVPFNLQVKHNHGRKWVVFGAGECTGILRIDGFGIKYQSTGEHSFQVSYDSLKSATVDKSRLTIQGVGVPDGKIELEPNDSSTLQAFSQLSAKIGEYRRLYADYMK